jgi:hypothetical protein
MIYWSGITIFKATFTYIEAKTKKPPYLNNPLLSEPQPKETRNAAIELQEIIIRTVRCARRHKRMDKHCLSAYGKEV